MTTFALLTSIGLCTALLSGISLTSTLWGTTGIGLAVGGAWFFGEIYRWRNIASPCMATMVFLSAASAIFGAAPLPLISATVLALAAWDLSRFRTRLTAAVQEQTRRKMEWQHLQRLLCVAVTGLAPAMLAAGLRLRGDFFAEIIMAAAVFFMLYRFVERIARWGDSR